MTRGLVLNSLAVAGLAFSMAWATETKTGPSSDIESAAAKILTEPQTTESVHAGFQGLVDALVRLSEAQKGVPDPVRTSVRTAAQALRAQPSFEGKGVDALHEAYRQMNQGKTFAFPSDVKGMAQAKARIQEKVEACVAANDRGDQVRAFRELLDVVLMIVTPQAESM